MSTVTTFNPTITPITNFEGQIIVGQWVTCSLYGLGLGVIYAIDDNVNRGMVTCTKGAVTTMRDGGNVFVAFLTGRKSTLSEVLLRKGIQFALVDKGLASQDTIDSLVTQSQELDAKLAADKALSEKMYKEEVSALRSDASLSYLVKFDERYPSASKVAKNLRAELKIAFKGIKFKVTASGRRATVTWTDGASQQQVRQLLDRYITDRLDESQQQRIHTFTPFNEVYGSVDSINFDRNYSDEMVEQALSIVCDEHQTATYSVEQYRDGRLFNVRFDDCQAYSVYHLVKFHLINHAVI
ncbi:LPD29 domain-containing protein [Vibrio sp. Hal054]|uniref:LPD29 domain-containing protein n=1 Tax=Vibrio sp. Hal054 TaxID=3035158 RepID=UPI00301C8F76